MNINKVFHIYDRRHIGCIIAEWAIHIKKLLCEITNNKYCVYCENIFSSQIHFGKLHDK